ncbi:hypothetical protein [Neptunicoccus cionae]|uniref:Uncharacterized protein n=1 Tax=Neptunicoccus cionae TaxID=2035344 RepID=A0A916QUQ2_9RHOB|nr:hypothetical protein [Amylibacter cionae]GGA14873.1 hypothetical protein GCM10011498_13920 [Amylibacter cionae]
MLAFILAHAANALMFVALLGASFLIGNDESPEQPVAVNFPKTEDSKPLLPRALSDQRPIAHSTPAAPQIVEAHAIEMPAQGIADTPETTPTAEKAADEDVVIGDSGDDMLWGASNAEPLPATSDTGILLLDLAYQVEPEEPIAPPAALAEPEAVEITDFDPAEDQLQIEYNAMTDPRTGETIPASLSVMTSTDGTGADIVINDVVVAKLAGVQGITPSHIQLIAR